MPHAFFAPDAAEVIKSIQAWTHENFGEDAAHRYIALIHQALLDIAEDPERIGSRRRLGIFENARTYHLSFSRNNVVEELTR